MILSGITSRGWAVSPRAAFLISSILDEPSGLVLVCSGVGNGAEELTEFILSELAMRRPLRTAMELGSVGEGDAVVLPHFRTRETAAECVAAATRALVVAHVASGELRGAVGRLWDMLWPEERLVEATVHVVTSRLLRPTPWDRARSVVIAAEHLRGTRLERHSGRLMGSPAFWSGGAPPEELARGSVLTVGVGRVQPPWAGDDFVWESRISLMDEALLLVAAGVVTLDEVIFCVPEDPA